MNNNDREAEFNKWYGKNVSPAFSPILGEYHDADAVFGEDVKNAWNAAQILEMALAEVRLESSESKDAIAAVIHANYPKATDEVIKTVLRIIQGDSMRVLHLEVGKTYVTESHDYVMIVAKHPVDTGVVGVNLTTGAAHVYTYDGMPKRFSIQDATQARPILKEEN